MLTMQMVNDLSCFLENYKIEGIINIELDVFNKVSVHLTRDGYIKFIEANFHPGLFEEVEREISYEDGRSSINRSIVINGVSIFALFEKDEINE